MRRRETEVLICLAIAGAIIWLGTGMLAGEKEAWDAPLFYFGALPTMLAMSYGVSAWSPGEWWQRGLALVLLQPLVMFARSANSGPDFGVIGAFVFVALFGLCGFAAWLGTLTHRYRHSRSPIQ